MGGQGISWEKLNEGNIAVGSQKGAPDVSGAVTSPCSFNLLANNEAL
jgi:hypothetical protein